MSLEEALDTVDAYVFTGDILYTDPSAIKSIEEYMGRWKREIATIEQSELEGINELSTE